MFEGLEQGFELELDEIGIRELLKSEEIEKLIEELANDVQKRAGENYHVEIKRGQKRVNAKIKPSSAHAYYSNLKHDTLTKALMGGSK